jgi:hypothetical protein
MKTIRVVYNGIEMEGTIPQISKLIVSLNQNAVTAQKPAPAARLKDRKELQEVFKSVKADNAEDFVVSALVAAGQPIHTVFSGMNEVIRSKYGKDPKDVIRVSVDETETGHRYIRKVTVGSRELKGHFSKGGLTISL